MAIAHTTKVRQWAQGRGCSMGLVRWLRRGSRLAISVGLVVLAPLPCNAQDIWDTVRNAGQQIRSSAQEACSEFQDTGQAAREAWDSDQLRGVRQSLEGMADRTETVISDTYHQYGPAASDALSGVRDKYGDEAARIMSDIYEAHGTGRTGAQVVGECERMLPELRRHGISLEAASEDITVVMRFRERAGTGGKHLVYRGLNYAVESLEFPTPDGDSVTMGNVYRDWIDESCPALRGCSLREDPAAIVTYWIIYCDAEYIFEEAELVPTGSGEFVTARGGAEQLARDNGAGYIIDVMETADTYRMIADGAREGRIDAQDLSTLTEQIEQLSAMESGGER